LRRTARIEFWFAEAPDAERRLFHGSVDYVSTSSEHGRTKIDFEARGLAAGLVDRPFKGEVGPTLQSVVTQLAEPAQLRTNVEYPETSLSAWINAESSYGVLRLLATSLGGVVRTKDDVVELLSKERYLARVHTKPAVQLTSAEIESSRTVQGQRVRK
jgi:hypothetical protein